MLHRILKSARWGLPTLIVGVSLLALFASTQPANAATITPITDPAPAAGSYGLEATKTQPPPTVPATVTTPGNGGSFSSSPITVSGICPDGLLVQVYDNNVLVGSVMCAGGSFTLQVTLFVGANDISAIVYDNLGQAGPTSNINTVTYNNPTLSAFGQLITLTSSYGRRSAASGAQLTWPLELSGGTGPYAFSIDWGDGSTSDLKSQTLAGAVDLAHTFNNAGIYQLNVRVTDANGVSAFLQLISVANGQAAAAPSTTKTATTTTTKVLWLPALIALLLIFPTYWLGRRSEVISLRNKMMKERDSYEQK